MGAGSCSLISCKTCHRVKDEEDFDFLFFFFSFFNVCRMVYEPERGMSKTRPGPKSRPAGPHSCRFCSTNNGKKENERSTKIKEGRERQGRGQGVGDHIHVLGAVADTSKATECSGPLEQVGLGKTLWGFVCRTCGADWSCKSSV